MKAMTKEEITKLCKENGWDGVINEDGTITLMNRKDADVWQCAWNAGFAVVGNTISAKGIYRRTKLEETDTREFLLECAEESANSIAGEYVQDSWTEGVHPDIAAILREAKGVENMLQEMKSALFLLDMSSALDAAGEKCGIRVQCKEIPGSGGMTQYTFIMNDCGISFCVDADSRPGMKHALQEIAEKIPGAASDAGYRKYGLCTCEVLDIWDRADRFAGLIYGPEKAADVIREITRREGISIYSYMNFGNRIYIFREKSPDDFRVLVPKDRCFGGEIKTVADELETAGTERSPIFTDGFREALLSLSKKIREHDMQYREA